MTLDILKGLEERLALKVIARRNNCSYQYVQQLARKAGVYDAWKADREKGQQSAIGTWRTRRNLIVLLKTRIVRSAQGWAYEKAAAYFNITKKHSFETLLTFFQRYETAKNEGTKPTRAELCQGLDILHQSASLILSTSGLKAFNADDSITESKLEAIARNAETKMTNMDLGYFLDTPYFVVQYYSRQLGIKGSLKQLRRVTIGPRKTVCLNYRLASQIYEAADLDFKQEEIAELLDANAELVRFALEKRASVEPELIEKLRIIYADKTINKPYKVKL